ncbi:MAG: hypothetical protein WCI11_19030 [Candidatus Methylumidiphilus sp.]
MLMGAFAIFTLVAVMGLSMVPSVWRGYAVEPGFPVLHGAISLVGATLVIFAALGGDTRLYVNIGLAVVIILLGVTMGVLGKKGKNRLRASLPPMWAWLWPVTAYSAFSR